MKKALKHWYLGGGNNPYVQAWLNRLTTLGYAKPSASYISKMNTAFNNAPSSMISSLDALYLYNNDGSIEASSVNVINPDLYQQTIQNSPVWTSGSQVQFGTNKVCYASTRWQDYPKVARDSGCQGVYIVTEPTNFITMGSFLNTLTPTTFSQINVVTPYFSINGLGSTTGAVTKTGHFLVSRSLAASFNVYRNGILHANIVDPSVSISGYNTGYVGVGARLGVAGFGSPVYSNAGIGVAYLGAGLDTYYSEMDTFIQTIVS